jgi:hypothetical protein
LNAGPLGQFNLPVTITPTSNTTFFIDPANGNDDLRGTAAEPWKTVGKVLDVTQPTGFTVAAAANAGNDVVVTILGGPTLPTEDVSGNINTPTLLAGSVTVLQAPFKKTFELDMQGNQLILNKGYKLQDIKITSAVGTSGTPPAVRITHPTAGLASVDVNCTGSNVICVKVEGAGSHTLRDVTVNVKDNNASNIGILIEANANLSIVGGIVKLTAITPATSQQPITLIQSNGVLTATGLTVDMTDGIDTTSGTSKHTKGSSGIVLNAAGSSVTNSTIKVNNGSSGINAVGIKVQHTSGTSTVKSNTFIGSGTNSVAITGGANLSSGASGALANNNFSGSFATPPVQ